MNVLRGTVQRNHFVLIFIDSEWRLRHLLRESHLPRNFGYLCFDVIWIQICEGVHRLRVLVWRGFHHIHFLEDINIILNFYSFLLWELLRMTWVRSVQTLRFQKFFVSVCLIWLSWQLGSPLFKRSLRLPHFGKLDISLP